MTALVHGPHAPTGVERRFGAEEIIVTKSDLKGRILYANEVFLRVAGYSEEEVIGRPHSILRHPDMPVAVFQLFWNRITAGDEVFALVNNLARDGANYWVFAHVTPTFDDAGRIVGYHSNRRQPDPSVIAAVVPLYRQVRALELRAHGQVTPESSALLAELTTAAHASYDEYVWSLVERAGGAQ